MRAANSCDDGWSTAAIGSNTSPLLYLPAQYPLTRTLVPVYRVVLYLRGKWHWHRVAKKRRDEARS